MCDCYRRTLATYITWSTVEPMLPFASSSFQLALAQLKMRIYGVSGEFQRWQKCTKYTDSALGFATGALYVDTYFSKADQLKVKTVLKFFHIFSYNVYSQLSIHLTWLIQKAKQRLYWTDVIVPASGNVRIISWLNSEYTDIMWLNVNSLMWRSP